MGVYRSMFGYFKYPNSIVPDYDPGLGVDCPVCNKVLSAPMVTVSLMAEGDSRSYFYRLHKSCADTVSPELETEIDSLLIDAIAGANYSN